MAGNENKVPYAVTKERKLAELQKQIDALIEQRERLKADAVQQEE